MTYYLQQFIIKVFLFLQLTVVYIWRLFLVVFRRFSFGGLFPYVRWIVPALFLSPFPALFLFLFLLPSPFPFLSVQHR